MASVWDSPLERQALESGSVSWGDYFNTAFNIGVPAVAGAVPAGVRWGAQAIPGDTPVEGMITGLAQYLEEKTGQWGKYGVENLTPAAKERYVAEVGSKEWWAHPISATMLQATGTVPSIAASLGATLFTAGGVPAMAAIGATGGLLSATQTVDEMYQSVDNMSEPELMQASTLYAGLRKSGMSSTEARQELTNKMIGFKPAALLAVGALTSVAGTPGQLARAIGVKGLGQAVEGGIAKRVGKEILQGGLTETVQTGAETYAGELGNVQGGLQDEVNYGRVASSALQGGIIGAVLGAPAGARAHPTTHANPRPAPINPPAVAVASAVKPNQASVPARGSNTQASPAIVSPTGTHTAPTSRAATIPGATPNQKKPKVAPNASSRPAATAGTAADPIAPAPIPPPGPPTQTVAPVVASKTASQGPQGDPTGLVAGTTETAALNTQIAPTGISGASTATPTPAATPTTAVSTDLTPAGNVAPTPAAAAPAPTPAPQVPARTTPGGGLGAGTPSVVQGRPSAFGGVEQPVTPAPAPTPVPAPAETAAVDTGPRVLPSLQAAPAPVVEKPAAPVRLTKTGKKASSKPGKGEKTKVRAEKRAADAAVAQSLLDQRPAEPNIPTTPEGIEGLKTELTSIIDSAKAQNVQFRQKVGYEKTPSSLVWLREAETLLAKLNNKKIKDHKERLDHISNFFDAEALIRTGDPAKVADLKARRNAAGRATALARMKGAGKNAAEGDGGPIKEGGSTVKNIAGEEETREVVQKGGEVRTEKVAKAAATREVSPEERAKIEARYAAQNAPAAPKPEPAKQIEAIKEKAAEEAAPKPLTAPVAEKVQASKKRTADKKAAQEANLPAGVKKPRTPINVKVTPEAVAAAKAKAEAAKAPPKPSAPAASSAEFAKQVKAEVEPNPSNAQIEADNASKAHPSIEGLPIAISTAANTERHIVKPDGSRISRLYKYAYGHILGTKSTDGQPIDIFLGPEAYPNNPKLEGLPVVVIDQVDPDTKLSDEPKVMFGFERITDPNKGKGAVEAYKESYPRGEERMGDVTPMTLNQFKQWVKSKRDIKNAQEPAGAPVSELDALVMEQTEDAAVDEDINPAMAGTPSRVSKKSMPERIESQRSMAEDRLGIVNQFSMHQEFVSDALDGAAKDIADAIPSPAAGAAHVRAWGIRKALYPALIARLKALVGDVEMHVVPDEVYELGLNQPTSAGYYDNTNDHIVIKASTATDPVMLARIVLHESVHAAFWKVTHEHPEFQNMLQEIMQEARYAAIGTSFEQHYGLSNVDEIMAESFSHMRFMEFMAGTKASNALAKKLGLSEEPHTLWDVLLRLIGKVLGLPKAHDSLLNAIIKTTAHMELHVSDLVGPSSDVAIANRLKLGDAGGYAPYTKQDTIRKAWKQASDNLSSPLSISDIKDTASDLRDRLPSKVSKLLGSTALSQEQAGSPWLMSLRTMDQLIQAAKSYGMPFYEHLRKVGDTIERIRTSAEKYLNEAIPLIRESHALERKYKGSGIWSRFVDLVHEETRVQVYADRDLALQKHLGKNTLKGAFPKAKWAEMNAEWQELSNLAPDLMDFRVRAMKHYSEQQNKMKLGYIKNTLKVAGFPDPDLAQRTFDGTETEADRALLGEVFDHIRDASELAKKEVYFPQMRRGDFVVRALYKITAPTNALRQIDENTWEFAGKGARKKAMAYAAAQDHLTPTVSSVWVDTNTGERYFNLGQPDEARVRPEDTDAEQRFRVNIQNNYVEFYETKREALRVGEELKSNPDVDTDSVKAVVEKRFNPGDRNADLMSYQMRTLASSLERRAGFQNLSAFEKNQVVQAFNVASLKLLGSTRIQSRRLPRTNVLGASRDFTRNMLEYSQSVSGYLAKLEHQDDLNTAMKGARAEADSSSDYGKTLGQSQIMNQVEERVARSAAFEPSGKFQEWANRLLGVSFASKLISPAYNILNSLQVAMVSYPALAARFGAGRAAMMLFRAYKDIGTGTVLKQGLAASKRALVSGPEAAMPSIVEDIISRIKSPQVRAMLNHLIEVGSIDANAGIEIADMIETRTGGMGTIDGMMNYVGTFGRQMPKAIEAINRTVTAIASYNLEMQRSGDHDTAVRFAQETTNMTQGLYSHSNAAPVFNHPLGKLSLQFKKFGQLMYGLLGHNIGKAIRAADPKDRAEARKTLAYMAATHFVMAGALGLPQEPLKWLIIAARQAGADISWADVENYERELLTSALGQQLGEIAARGVTRALPEGFAFDLSSRVGMQDLLTFGEPRSADKQDLSAFLWDTVGGAPAGLVGDWAKGSQALMNGDFGEAAQRFSPIKLVTDAIKSYRTTSGSQKTAAGYEKLSPYGMGEAALRAIGFTPAREAETNEARSYYASAQKSATAARDTMLHRWADAAPSERGRIWGQVEKFNYGKAKDERLTRSDLDKYAKRRRTEEKSGLVQGGFRVTKRDKPLYKKVQGTYSYQ